METILSTNDNQGHLKIYKQFVHNPDDYYHFYAGIDNINFTKDNKNNIIYDLPFTCYGKLCHMRRGQLLELSNDIIHSKNGYSFSGITIPSNPISSISQKLLDLINSNFKDLHVNSFLHNYYRKYRQGEKPDSLSAHSDNESSLIHNTVIGISFIEHKHIPRIIRFKHKQSKQIYDIEIYSGDLYIMEGRSFQNEFTHEIIGYKKGNLSTTNVISLTSRKF